MNVDTWFGGGTAFTAVDYGVVALCLLALLAIGWATGRGETDTNGFFLGRRRIPWWAACLSFVATEISAVTIVSVPATGFRENWQYAQYFIGSVLARVVIAALFIPAFYRINCTTIYEYLGRRFGPVTQVAGSAFFFVTRLLASGVRLMAASMAVAVLLGWHIVLAILLFTLIGIAYIAYGGVRAVVWTGVLQGATFIVGGLATLWFLLSQIPGGAASVMETAGAAGRLSLWNWGPQPGDPAFWRTILTDPNVLWLAILNGFFFSAAAFGTDHDLMQRLLTVETRRASQRTMLMTSIGSFAVLVIYLGIGSCLFAFYAQHPELPLPAKLDGIYPHFVATVMPALLRGLVLAAVVMASIDSPLSSLAASFVIDIYRPWLRSGASERHYLRISRAAVVGFGLVLAAIAYGFSFFERILWLAFKIGGVTFGSLLGVFLFGLLTRRRADRTNVAAMLLWAVVNLVLLVLSERGVVPIAWSWLVIFGTLGTFAVAYLLGTPGETLRDGGVQSPSRASEAVLVE